MSKAVAALSQVAYIAEATENTTPATPGFTVLRVSGESLAVNRKFSYGSELNGKRGEKNYAVDTSAGGGGFDFDGLTYGTFDAFIAAALFSAWSANVVQDATTLTSMTFETKFESGGTDVYKRLTGAYFSQLDLSFKPGARISGKASVMAMSGAFSNAAIAGATYAAGNTNPVLVGADMGSLSLSGLTFDQIAGIDLSIKNTLTERYALGTLTPVGIGMGQVEVTGKIDLYVDSSMYNILTAAQSGTSTGLSFQVGRTGGSKYQIDLPTLVIEAPTADAKSAAGDIMASINFRALQDVSTLSGSVIKVTRAI